MRGIIRTLSIFFLFYIASMPAYADKAGLHQAEHYLPDCAVSKQAPGSRSQRDQLHAGKGCKNKKTFKLMVTLEGAGSGRVSSDPLDIYCQLDCSEIYAKNTRVVLSAQPYTGSVFTGWSGDCSGTGPCSIKLKRDTTVIANFIRIESPPLSLVTPYVNEFDMRDINDFFNAQYDTLAWGRIHDGLDIDPDGNLKPFQSACSGRVRKIYPFDEQVTLIIDCDATYSIEYNFEAQAPNTGQIQLDHILVTEGQLVAQGEVIGYLYSAESPDRAHVHFTLYENAVPICPAPFFSQAGHDSILNLVAVVHQNVVMCRSANVMPPPLVTPYLNESDMARITAGYSAAYSLSPWGFPNDGLDIYPKGEITPLQAGCSGKIDALELQQDGFSGNWQVEAAIVCDEYVMDPESGGYFIPLTIKYYLQTMSSDPVVGQAQLNNILAAPGQTVTQGSIIGYLDKVNEDTHLHFELLQFGQSEFQVFGITGIPLCPQAQFSLSARNSVLNLLQTAWPGAELCYQ